MKSIEFISDYKYYIHEKNGNKSNTIREVDLNDDRFLNLIKMKTSGKYGFIIIKCNEYKIGLDSSFKRKITDISFYKNFVIISW